MLRFLFCCLLLLGALAPVAAQEPPGAAAIRAAFAAGSDRGILAHAGDRIEIGLLGATQRYSRDQAGFVLRTFFRENPPKRVVPGPVTRTSDGWFAAMDYWALRSSSPMRIYLRLRQEEGTWVLREIVVRRHE